MEKNMDNEIETGGIQGFEELNLRLLNGQTLQITVCVHYSDLTEVTILGECSRIFKCLR